MKGKTHERFDLVGYDEDDERMFGRGISTSGGEHALYLQSASATTEIRCFPQMVILCTIECPVFPTDLKGFLTAGSCTQ